MHGEPKLIYDNLNTFNTMTHEITSLLTCITQRITAKNILIFHNTILSSTSTENQISKEQSKIYNPTVASTI